MILGINMPILQEIDNVTQDLVQSGINNVWVIFLLIHKNLCTFEHAKSSLKLSQLNKWSSYLYSHVYCFYLEFEEHTQSNSGQNIFSNVL